MKLYLVGMRRSGKDTAAQYIKDKLGLTFESSSVFCCKQFIFGVLAPQYGYTTIEDCFEDRFNHRPEWFNLIRDYNKDDPFRLSKEIFAEYDIYVGIRNRKELMAGIPVVWIDSEGRTEAESSDSCQIDKSDCDIIIENKWSEPEFFRKLDNFIELIRK